MAPTTRSTDRSTPDPFQLKACEHDTVKKSRFFVTFDRGAAPQVSGPSQSPKPSRTSLVATLASARRSGVRDNVIRVSVSRDGSGIFEDRRDRVRSNGKSEASTFRQQHDAYDLAGTRA